MQKKITLFFIIILCCPLSACTEDPRPKIEDYLNKEIRIVDNFAGQSITLIKENNVYFIMRKIFGSGVPVIGSSKYKVVFNSDYQIAFSEIVDSSMDNSLNNNKEEFILSVQDDGLNLYLNRLKVVIIK